MLEDQTTVPYGITAVISIIANSLGGQVKPCIVSLQLYDYLPQIINIHLYSTKTSHLGIFIIFEKDKDSIFAGVHLEDREHLYLIHVV